MWRGRRIPACTRKRTRRVRACAVDDVDEDEEDVIRFDHAGATYAIYRSPEDEFFATDGLCTHECIWPTAW